MARFVCSRYLRATVSTAALLVYGWSFTSALGEAGPSGASDSDALPNNFPHRNPAGYSATFSTQGSVDLTGEYFQAQGRADLPLHLLT
jgi:hypothetical protein